MKNDDIKEEKKKKKSCYWNRSCALVHKVNSSLSLPSDNHGKTRSVPEAVNSNSYIIILERDEREKRG